MTAFEIVPADERRADDGSCPQRAGCPYLLETDGGTGEAISTKKGGKSTYDPIAVAPEREVVVEEKLSTGAIIGIAIGASVAGLAVLGCGLFLFRMYSAEKKGTPIFKAVGASGQTAGVEARSSYA
jgi:hypothetical protein